jgi:hypothetical protein
MSELELAHELAGREVLGPDDAPLGRVEAVVVSVEGDRVVALEVAVPACVRVLPWPAVRDDGDVLRAQRAHLLAGDAPAFYRRHGRRLEATAAPRPTAVPRPMTCAGSRREGGAV